MRSLHFLTAAVLLCSRGITVAQSQSSETTETASTCIFNKWTFNQKGQSPCEVAAIIQGTCTGGFWDVPAIQKGSVYSGPRQGQSTKCQCNTVAFSVVGACGWCQNGQSTTWETWVKNCSATDVAMNTYPPPIPDNTSIPSWAYLPVIPANQWDNVAANNKATLNLPDVTGTETGPASTNSASTTPVPTGTSSSSSSSSSSSHAGAIAGGVVGGVVGLALLTLGGFLLWRRGRGRETAPSAQFVKGTGSEKVDLVGSPTPVQGPYVNGDGFQSPQSPHLPMQTETPKLYDPSDPSTYPPAHVGVGTPISLNPQGAMSPGWTSPSPSVPYSQASGPYSHSYGHQHQGSGTFGPPQPMGGYSGAPEV